MGETGLEPPLEESSSESPYMLLPDSQSSEMRLVIEGSGDTQIVTPANTSQTVEVTIPSTGESQCCLLL
jgi:hypothetical protein